MNFGNDTNNTLDTGFGYANAALGIFTQYLQASRFIEGNLIYNQIEFFVQDNWKVTNRLTLDYGLRFVNMGPQYDQFQQMSNFFPDQWKASDAPVLYIAGCKSGATTCSGNDRNAMDPRTNTILTATGAANTQAAIGTPIPGTGNLLNGIKKAGDGIAKTNYEWPALVVGPRFGFAYDLTGNSNWVLRGGFGLFYDRPDGNTTFSTPGNPPTATAQDLRNGQLATLGQGLSPQPVPTLITFQYEAKVPASWQWQAGFQKSLPWGMVGDVMYVGNHGYQPHGVVPGRNASEPELGGLRRGVSGAEPGPDARHEHDSRGDGLHLESAPSLQGFRQYRREPAGVLGHVSLDPGEREPAVPGRVLVRSQLHVWDLPQGQHGAEYSVPARGRRDDLGAV